MEQCKVGRRGSVDTVKDPKKKSKGSKQEVLDVDI